MEIKKSPETNAEKSKLPLFLLGLLFALGMTLAVLELKSAEPEKKVARFENLGLEDEIIEEVELAIPETPPPPPPPPPAEPEVVEVVEDDKEVEETLVVEDQNVEEKIEVVEVVEEVVEEPVIEEIFTVVEQAPEFPGGTPEMYKYLGQNMKYPQMAKEAGVQGKVFVQFVVEKDGSITDTKVLRGIGTGCDEEALRVVNKMPNWKPGKQRGKPVRVKYTLPVHFKLQ